MDPNHLIEHYITSIYMIDHRINRRATMGFPVLCSRLPQAQHREPSSKEYARHVPRSSGERLLLLALSFRVRRCKITNLSANKGHDDSEKGGTHLRQ